MEIMNSPSVAVYFLFKRALRSFRFSCERSRLIWKSFGRMQKFNAAVKNFRRNFINTENAARVTLERWTLKAVIIYFSIKRRSKELRSFPDPFPKSVSILECFLLVSINVWAHSTPYLVKEELRWGPVAQETRIVNDPVTTFERDISRRDRFFGRILERLRRIAMPNKIQ